MLALSLFTLFNTAQYEPCPNMACVLMVPSPVDPELETAVAMVHFSMN